MSNRKKIKNNSLRLSEMIPLIGKNQDLRKKAFLIPGILTVLLVIGLFSSRDNPGFFNFLLGIYLTGGGYYVIYRQVGKSKPWWLLLGTAIATILLMVSPIFSSFDFVFRHILPGQLLTDRTQVIPLFIHMFFGAGMLEELFKVLPVFLALGIGKMLRSPWREQIGVWEPLDGILLASASAAGFTLLETLGQYVPDVVKMTAEAGVGTDELAGLHVLIPRLIGQIAGHIAYSGYFGYFIGLSVLKPRKSWLILVVGYLTAATLHALWNAAPNIWVSIFAGILAYTFLMAAILKARELSPDRSQNWATIYAPSSSPPPQSSVPTVISSPFCLSINQRLIPLDLGRQIPSQEIPGLGAQSRGVVAQVTSHPQDPHKLGLKNCSYQAWSVTFLDGQQTNIDSGKNIKLAIGMRINFGAVTGEIRARST